MCGITGKMILGSGGDVDPADVRRMTAPIRHRGPDDEGVYLHRNVGLGHRRLTIIDLASGAQPLSNEDGTVWVVFNGEIYNYRELREELVARGHTFRTRSDTEVLVHLYEERGPEFVRDLNGMFALAIHDQRDGTLLLARDRVGIKPLYWALVGDTLLFGSEIKSILADPTFTPELDPRAVRRFLAYYYVPGEETLLKGVRKLPPAHTLVARGRKVAVERYWDLEFNDSRAGIGLDEAAEELDRLLARVVREHLISDVPLGVLLSGGLDSSGVLSYAAEVGDRPLSTFTIGFDADGVVDERPYAEQVARQYGTDHHEITIAPDDFCAFLPTYVAHMEEPVCEPPAVALYYVSRLARDHVKVVLSGEGGDEAFAGYSNYPKTLLIERLKRALGPAAPVAGTLLRRLGNAGILPRLAPGAEALRRPLEEYYFSRTSGPTKYFNGSDEAILTTDFRRQVDAAWSTEPTRALFGRVRSRHPLDRMLYVDTNSWLPDDLLLKADKITMANSIELRVPLLDHRVLEFAASLPQELKLSRGEGKRVLRRCLERRVPRAVLDRKKAGFPVPYGAWMARDESAFVRDVLLGERGRARGILDAAEVERLLAAPGTSRAKEIFSLVVLELWMRIFLDGDPVPAAESARSPLSSVAG